MSENSDRLVPSLKSLKEPTTRRDTVVATAAAAERTDESTFISRGGMHAQPVGRSPFIDATPPIRAPTFTSHAWERCDGTVGP